MRKHNNSTVTILPLAMKLSGFGRRAERDAVEKKINVIRLVLVAKS
jgi:hypothetical protein